jgi:hypothetical protein
LVNTTQHKEKYIASFEPSPAHIGTSKGYSDFVKRFTPMLLFLSACIGVLYYLNRVDNLQLKLSVTLWVLYSIFSLLIGTLLVFLDNRRGTFDNWLTWNSLVHNKNVTRALLLVTIFPVLLKLLKIFENPFDLNLKFFVLWAIALFLYIFTLFYKLLAPNVYQYKDYDTFYKVSESFRELKEDAKHTLSALEKRKDKLKTYEKNYFDEDIVTLKAIVNSTPYSKADAFYTLRIRAMREFPATRFFVSLPLIPAFFLFILISMSNIALVVEEANIYILCSDSIVKEMLDVRSQSTIDKQKECLSK